MIVSDCGLGITYERRATAARADSKGSHIHECRWEVNSNSSCLIASVAPCPDKLKAA